MDQDLLLCRAMVALFDDNFLSAQIFPQSSGESDHAFEAFRAYLELGPRCRLAAVSREIGISPRTVRRVASGFDWRGRIRIYTVALECN